MHGMSGTLGDNAAQNLASGKRQISDEVQDLMTDELVFKAQRPIHDTLAGKNDRARFRNTADEAHVAQHLLIFLKTEGACRGNLAAIAACRQVYGYGLLANGGGEVNVIRNAVTFARIDADEFISIPHFYFFQDAQVLAFSTLCLDSYLFKGLDVGQGAAVKDRQLQVVELDDDIVYASANQGREQVLSCRNKDALAHQAGSVADLGHVAAGGRNFKVVEIGTAKDDSGTGRRRQQTHPDGCSAVQPDAGKFNEGGNGLLVMQQWIGQKKTPESINACSISFFNDIDYFVGIKFRCCIFATQEWWNCIASRKYTWIVNG